MPSVPRAADTAPGALPAGKLGSSPPEPDMLSRSVLLERLSALRIGFLSPQHGPSYDLVVTGATIHWTSALSSAKFGMANNQTY